MIKMIPTPKKYEISDKICTVPCKIYTEEESFRRGCEILSDAFQTLYSMPLVWEKGGIELVQDTALAQGSYVVEAKDGIKAYAPDTDGILYALATLLQLINFENGNLVISQLHIEDYPDKGYRSLMVDLSREWHPFHRVLKYVDVCFYLKIKHLHLHF